MGITLVRRCLMHAGHPDLAFLAIGANEVQSLVRGAWVIGGAEDPALRAWHRVVLREASV